jgi:hypothetical protein
LSTKGCRFSRRGGLEDAVGDGGGVAGGTDVMDAEDVRSGEYGCGVGDSSGKHPVMRRGRKRFRTCGTGGGVGGEPAGEEALAGDTGEQREAQRVELIKICEQREVFVEGLAESESGVEDYGVAGNARGEGRFGTGFETGEDEWKDLRASDCGKGAPLLRSASWLRPRRGR